MIRDFLFPQHVPILRRLSQLSLGLFFVFLFIPLKLRLYEAGVFFNGDFNPYTTFFIHSGDVFFFLFLVFIGVSFLRNEVGSQPFSFGRHSFLIFWLIFLLLGQIATFLSPSPVMSFLFLLRWTQMVILYLAIINRALELNVIFRIIIYALVAQSLVALTQYFFGTSIGFGFLGEPVLSIGSSGIATVNFLGHSFLRGYGTFLHPNILAGYFVFGLFIISRFYKTRPRLYGSIGVLLSIGLLVTFSRSAILAILLFFVLYFFLSKSRFSVKRGVIIASTILFFLVALNIGSVMIERFRFTDHAALTFRLQNISTSFELFRHHPFGTGLGASTIAMQDISSVKFSPWEYQPAHNFFLLVANELGFIGFIFIVVVSFYFFRYMYRKRTEHPRLFALSSAMFLLAFFDHYFLTSYQGQVLFMLFVTLVSLETDTSHSQES